MQELIKLLLDNIKLLDIDLQIEAINNVKLELHKISPFKDEPVDCVLWVKNNTVQANDYNPNSVAPKEMELLRVSIWQDWYTQPIVTMDEEWQRIVIDWFHRNRVWKECPEIQARVQWYLPVVTINDIRTDRSDRMASTIRHNRARWTHKVDSMSDIIVELKKRNWSDEKIGKELWMEPDEVLRLSQIQWLASMFADNSFSEAWEAEDDLIDQIPENEITEDISSL